MSFYGIFIHHYSYITEAIHVLAFNWHILVIPTIKKSFMYGSLEAVYEVIYTTIASRMTTSHKDALVNKLSHCYERFFYRGIYDGVRPYSCKVSWLNTTRC